MAKEPKTFYLTNKDLMREIHNSKMSFCWTKDDKYTGFDAIVYGLDEITESVIAEAKKSFASRKQKEMHEAEINLWEQGLTGKKTKPRGSEFAVDPDSIKLEDIVIRVMTFSHIPSEARKNKPKLESDHHAKCNFPPFKHYAYIDGEWQEVVRSHWEGGLDNGAFSTTHGTTNRTLAKMYIKLCERYSMRGNWRGYTYVDEMRGQALLQLTQIGLQFNEAKSSNPFAYYTAAINNSFTRVLNLEKRSQNIRDDLLEEEGLDPSWTRLFNAEWDAQQSANTHTIGEESTEDSLEEDTTDLETGE